MQLSLLCIGKTSKSFLEDGEKEYLKRLSYYLKFDVIELADIKNTKNLTEEQIKQKEGQSFFKKIAPNDRIILLDERGDNFSSVQFSKFLQEQFNLGGKRLVFVIGGPYGFSDEMYKRSNHKISLSKMTFSHQMIRLFFIEQVYRSMTIIKGEPYHHE
jgi:23S rRNA (pseudouridine1915-N3)-methyltransferase